MERAAELELNLSKDTEKLVNARAQIFFADTNERGMYCKSHIEPFFLQGLQQVDHPKYPGVPVREYSDHGLAIGVNLCTLSKEFWHDDEIMTIGDIVCSAS